MTALVIQLDAEVAPHLARALSGHLRWCRDNGVTVPDGLIEALEWAQVVVRGLNSPSPLPGDDSGPVEPLILTLPQTAELLGCSVTKVKTLIDTGQLLAVDFGGVRRVRRADIDVFLEHLAGGSSFRDDITVKAPVSAAHQGRRDRGGADGGGTARQTEARSTNLDDRSPA